MCRVRINPVTTSKDAGSTPDNSIKAPHFDKRPKRIKMINSDDYFNNITKQKPDELLKEEDRYDFFKRKVGKPHDHFKSLTDQIKD